MELKKRILRTVIEEIVLTNSEREHQLQIHWAGGVHTALRVPRNRIGVHGRTASGSVIEMVRELAKVCADETIAGALNRLGHATGQGKTWCISRVLAFRHTHEIAAFAEGQGWLTLQEAARKLQVSHTVVRALIDRGVLPAKQVVKGAPWVIETKDLEVAAVEAAIRRTRTGKRIPSTVSEHPELPIK